MSTWQDTLLQRRRILESRQRVLASGDGGGSQPFYRGQASASWQLLPGLARKGGVGIENSLYYDFRCLREHLFPPGTTSKWSQLFLMQHHGCPTRLLDWTESFAVALFFAITDADGDAAVWILDPVKLNGVAPNDAGVAVLVSDYPVGYEAYFADYNAPEYGSFPHDVMALSRESSNPRLRAQKGVFTLHQDLNRPLEDAHRSCVHKLTIPSGQKEDAREFLGLTGMDLYTLFPDLDALSQQVASRALSGIVKGPIASND